MAIDVYQWDGFCEVVNSVVEGSGLGKKLTAFKSDIIIHFQTENAMFHIHRDFFDNYDVVRGFPNTDGAPIRLEFHKKDYDIEFYSDDSMYFDFGAVRIRYDHNIVDGVVKADLRLFQQGEYSEDKTLTDTIFSILIFLVAYHRTVNTNE